MTHAHIKALSACAVMATLTACATGERAAFDPSVDARIGEEVDRACVRNNSLGGGTDRLGDYTTMIIGSRNDKYLLVFSSGCRDIEFGAAPVFVNRGDQCRRRGEIVNTFNATGTSGGCTISKIYRWREDAEAEGSADIASPSSN